MVVCDAAIVLAIMAVLMAMLMAMMMVVVGDDDGACDIKHVGSDGVGDDADDAMLIMVAAAMMRRGRHVFYNISRTSTMDCTYIYIYVCIYIYMIAPTC